MDSKSEAGWTEEEGGTASPSHPDLLLVIRNTEGSRAVKAIQTWEL